MTRVPILPPTEAGIATAVAALAAGRLVGLPTETVYGLAADATRAEAVAAIFATKQRPSTHPLIVHLATAAELSQWAQDVPNAAWRLAEAFWPGPLTLILERHPNVSRVVTGGLDTVALRIPRHSAAREVIATLGHGIAAPSANRFGRVSPTTAEDVAREFDAADVALVLDGGPCEVGIESTIVDVRGITPALLRPGDVTLDAISAVLGIAVIIPSAPTARAPGQHASHYAPDAALWLTAGPDEAIRTYWQARSDGIRAGLITFGAQGAGDVPASDVITLPSDPRAAARVLYRAFRAADHRRWSVVISWLPPASGAGLALVDRMNRAAAGRIEGEIGPE